MTRSITPLVCVIALSLLLVPVRVRTDGAPQAAAAAASAAPAQAPAPAGTALALRNVYLSASGGVRDTNGDGWADDIVARIIVPGTPSAGDIEAATNLAGRFGFETMAATLPIVVRENEIAAGKAAAIGFPVIVGRENTIVKKLAASGVIDIASLKPGQGLIAAVHAPLGGADGVVVTGGDDEGTLAAGIELAARLPRLWSMTGITLGAIEEQATAYLRAQNVTPASVAVSQLVVDRERRGLAKVVVRATVDSADAAAKATKALQDLDGAHRRGLDARTLNFANAAATDIELMVAGKMAGHAVVERSGLNPRTLTPPIDPDELATDSPGERGRPADAPQPGSSKAFDLTDVFSIQGWLGDGYTDLIPDRLDTSLVLGPGVDALSAAHIAARLGLESTGVTLPLTKLASKVKEPSREPNPILIGREHPLIADLVKVGKVHVDDLTAGEGLVQVVPHAFGNATATVVTGADAAGTDAASLYLARRAPYVWENARGSVALDDVSHETTKFLQAKNAAGQAAQILGELDGWLKELKDREPSAKPIESIDAKLFVETVDPKLTQFVTDRIKTALGGTAAPPLKVTSQGMTDPVNVFEEKIEVPWEVEEFRQKLASDVIPKIKAGSKVDLEARLSESPEIRQKLATEVKATLTKAGATDPQVRILSAYKQGYLWLTEQVIPSLKGKGVKSVRIQVAKVAPDLSKKYKFYEVPSRWVHELYPVDDVFARDLGVVSDDFHLELVDAPKDIYTLDALDAAGKVVQHATFTPKTVEREYLDKFPGWSRVTVTTGWLSASVDGASAIDTRIATDPERFWEQYQSKILPRIYDNVMKITENKPLPDKQPFHRDLDVEVWMSEPDFRIGLDEEQISSLESLHEDLYFVTLDFFDALGRTTVKRRLAAPGKIFPIIHPSREGQAGTVRVLYAGNASSEPKLELSYKEKGVEKPVRSTRKITKIDATTPQVLRAVVTGTGIKELELSIDAKDDREAARAADAWDALEKLHTAGLYRTALSYDHIGRIALGIATKEARTRRVLPYTGEHEPSPVHPRSDKQSTEKPSKALITWDHIISPEESEQISTKLAVYPEVHSYVAGHSYRGRSTSVLEIMLPNGGEQVSLAKATAYKPTIFITGRQHANEVSSTSHILRLAELLVTDPAYHAILNKVNVILHPVENPDGAAMAYELQKLTPNHMLHAGRYSALGMDVGSQVNNPDPLLPEALVRNRVWRDWLPDIYLNPHGYPSHEWVQQFAGYVPPGFRSYWSTRGWYTNVTALRDPRYPDHARVAESIREAIVREVNASADVRAMNLRSQARYRRWAFGFEPYVFNQEIYKDTAIYYSDPESGQVTGSRRAGANRFGGEGGGGGGRDTMGAYPQVTVFNGMTESPDETAQAPWLDLATKPGFAFLMANVRYLQHGEFDVQRIEEDGQRDSASLTMFRARPVKPARGTEGNPTNTSATK